MQTLQAKENFAISLSKQFFAFKSPQTPSL